MSVSRGWERRSGAASHGPCLPTANQETLMTHSIQRNSLQCVVLVQLLDGTPDDRLAPHLNAESLRAWELDAAGICRSLHARTDVRGVLGLLEATDLADARQAIDSLPRGNVG
jgi:hypothetical protein